MKTMVVAIESGKQFTDGKARVTLLVGDCDSLYNKLRFPRELLGTTVELDEEIGIDLKLVGMTVTEHCSCGDRDHPCVDHPDMGAN